MADKSCSEPFRCGKEGFLTEGKGRREDGKRGNADAEAEEVDGRAWCSERQPVTNIGRWRWADRSLAQFLQTVPRIYSAFFFCTVRCAKRSTSPPSFPLNAHLFYYYYFTCINSGLISLPTYRGTLFLRSAL